MEELPAVRPTYLIEYPVGLAVEVALNEAATANSGSPLFEMEELCKQFDITMEDYARIKNNVAFRAEVRQHLANVKENNGTVKRKAAMAAEFYLDNLVPTWLNDSGTSVDVKLKVVQFLAKMGRLVDDPAEKARLEALEASKNIKSNSGPSINLIFPPGMQPPTQVVEKVIDG